MSTEWALRLFEGFCSSPELDRSSAKTIRRIARYATAFQQLERKFASPHQISLEALFQVFGRDGLRRYDRPLQFVMNSLRIQWDEDALKTWHEESRLAAIINSRKGETADILKKFSTSLATGSLSSRAKICYLEAARRLLDELDGRDLEFTQKSINAFLRRFPGFSASIRSFLTFLKATGAVSETISLPPARRSRGRALEKQLSAAASDANRRLNDFREKNAAVPLGLIVWAIHLYTGISIEKILSAKWVQQNLTEFPRTLVLGDLSVPLIEPLREIAGSNLKPGLSPYLFPGRNPSRQLHPATVRYWAKALSI